MINSFFIYASFYVRYDVSFILSFFFFFQAEDGIRDYKVTGVQTCALPILRLLAAGHRVVYAESALAYTEAPETARALLKQRFRWTYGVLQACWKHKGRLLDRKSVV